MTRALSLAAAAGLTLAAGCAGPSAIFTSERELAPRTVAPTMSVAATLTRPTALRTGPADGAPALAQLDAGAQVTAADAPSHGYRRVRTADGKSGFVEDGAIQAAPAPQPAAAPASTVAPAP